MKTSEKADNLSAIPLRLHEIIKRKIDILKSNHELTALTDKENWLYECVSLCILVAHSQEAIDACQKDENRQNKLSNNKPLIKSIADYFKHGALTHNGHTIEEVAYHDNRFPIQFPMHLDKPSLYIKYTKEYLKQNEGKRSLEQINILDVIEEAFNQI